MEQQSESLSNSKSSVQNIQEISMTGSNSKALSLQDLHRKLSKPSQFAINQYFQLEATQNSNQFSMNFKTEIQNDLHTYSNQLKTYHKVFQPTFQYSSRITMPYQSSTREATLINESKQALLKKNTLTDVYKISLHQIPESIKQESESNLNRQSYLLQELKVPKENRQRAITLDQKEKQKLVVNQNILSLAKQTKILQNDNIFDQQKNNQLSDILIQNQGNDEFLANLEIRKLKFFDKYLPENKKVLTSPFQLLKYEILKRRNNEMASIFNNCNSLKFQL